MCIQCFGFKYFLTTDIVVKTYTKYNEKQFLLILCALLKSKIYILVKLYLHLLFFNFLIKIM